MFIVVEGIDGCGKSTVASLLATEIGKKRPVFHTFEPGHVRDGLYRQLIMENVDNPFVVAALFTIDRAEHVRKMIKPALAKGEWVVCERYADSTLAYQGYGMGLDKELKNILFVGSPAKQGKGCFGRSGVRILTKGAGGIRRNRTHFIWMQPFPQRLS